jgi:hypothetical protein
MPLGVPHGQSGLPGEQARPGRPGGRGRGAYQPYGLVVVPRGTARDPVDQRVVGEPGEREVEVDGGGLPGVLALGGRPCRPVQLVGPEPQQSRLLLGVLGLGDVLEEPPDTERNRFFRER